MALCSTNYPLTGTDFVSDNMGLGVPVMAIFTTSSFELSDANIVLYAKVMEQVRLQRAFPVKITDLVKNHEESTKVTHPNKKRVKTAPQKRRYTAMVDSNFCTAAELLKFDGWKGGVLILFSENKIWGYHYATDKNRGIPVDFVEVVGVDTPNADGSDVSQSSIVFDLTNVNYMTRDGFIETLDHNPLDINGLTPVSVTQTAASTNSSTKLYIDVYSDCGDGCEYPITGMAITDFSINTATLTSIDAVSGADGSYVITGTGFANGQILQVNPTNSVRDDNPVKSVTHYTVATIPA